MKRPPLLTASNLAKAFGSDPLFQELSFGLEAGEQLGLIGPNGTGKSTLLKILVGLEPPDEGEVIATKGLVIAYVAQAEAFTPGQTAKEHLSQALPHLEEAELEALMSSAGFTRFDQPLEALSGGYKKRLQILKALGLGPDLLLLDEPTNHLDLEGIFWLEATLKGAAFAYAMVSHDRAFLEAVCHRIIELGHHFEKGYFEVRGGYQAYLAQKADYLDDLERRGQAMKSKSRREEEWLKRGPKARTTKARFRIEEAGRLREELARIKSLRREKPKLGIDFEHTLREGKKLLDVYNLGLNLGERELFSGIKFKLGPGQRLGLMGPNGSGKSSLMKLLMGRGEPTSGSVKTANDLHVVYFDQDREQLDLSLSLKETICPEGDAVVYRGKSIHVITWAKRFLFPPDQLEQPVSTLSGGERARALIARLMLQPADLLLLDEPTNDLDIPALEVLEESLLEFPGAIVMVSHDRFLLEQVATGFLALDGRGGHGMFVSLEHWQEWAFSAKAPAPKAGGAGKSAKGNSLSIKRNFFFFNFWMTCRHKQ